MSEMDQSTDPATMNRREGVRRGAVAALALSLGIAPDLLSHQGDPDRKPGRDSARYEFKLYVGDRLVESLPVGSRGTRYLDGRPTAVQLRWYDLEVSRERPLSVLGFTESLQIKMET